MGQEEQIEEREVLDSIFPDEITGKSPFLPPPFSLPSQFSCPTSPPSKLEHPTNQLINSVTDISETSYRVEIKLDIPRQDDDDETEPRQLLFLHPPTHPLLCLKLLWR